MGCGVRSLACFLFAMASASQASGEEGGAEAASPEVERLAAKEAWNGVLRHLAALGVDTLNDREARLGARASIALGQASLAYEYLARLDEVGAATDVERVQLRAYQTDYAWVRIDLHRKVGGRTLQARRSPLDVDQVRAIDWADEVLHHVDTFQGLLPVGRYELDCRSLEVSADGGVFYLPRRSRAQRRQEVCTSEPVRCYAHPSWWRRLVGR